MKEIDGKTESLNDGKRHQAVTEVKLAFKQQDENTKRSDQFATVASNSLAS